MPTQFTEKKYRFYFGKHKGKLVQEVESGYLKYLLNQDWFEDKYEELYDEVEREVEWRDETEGHFYD